MCLAQVHNTVKPVRLGPASPVLSQALNHCAPTNFEKTFNFWVWEEKGLIIHVILRLAEESSGIYRLNYHFKKAYKLEMQSGLYFLWFLRQIVIFKNFSSQTLNSRVLSFPG